MNIGTAETIPQTVNEITTGKKIPTRVSGGVRTKTIDDVVQTVSSMFRN
jgi:nicotinate-nucleotide pyrophosphorylase